jgi:hypothetical protein
MLEMGVFVFCFAANGSPGTSAHGSAEDLNQKFDVNISLHSPVPASLTSFPFHYATVD